MINDILFFLHYGLTLLAGVLLSAAFCGVHFTRKNIALLSGILLFCGVSQLTAFLLLSEEYVWKLYPLLVHTPLVLFLCLVFRKRLISVLASVFLTYLCCQPSKWFGLLTGALTDVTTVTWIVRIFVMLTVVFLSLRYFADNITEIFQKDTRSVLIFSCVPFVYYLFDYIVAIYTDLWQKHYQLTSEFLAFFLCLVFMAFCLVYYREYETKMQIQQKNQLIEITVAQQAKEIEAIRKSNLETSLLRHDMRLLLSNLSVSIEQNDLDTARNLISGYTALVDAAVLHRYCQNDTVNYVLTYFESKCRDAEIPFYADVEADTIQVNELLFSSIISNGLDNAINAQAELPKEQRKIHLLLKDSGGKLLLSIKNPYRTAPANFINQLPISTKEGHGYGTQSIQYMTEKLGGKCQFSLQDNTFILRVIL